MAQDERVQLHPLVKKLLGEVTVDEVQGPRLSDADFATWIKRCKALVGKELEVFAHLGALALDMSRKGAEVFSLQCLVLCSLGAKLGDKAFAPDNIEEAKKMADKLRAGTGPIKPSGLAAPGSSGGTGVGIRKPR